MTESPNKIFEGSGVVYIKPFGRVVYKVRQNSVTIKMHWEGSELHLSLPYGITYGQVEKILNREQKRMMEYKPTESLYYINQSFDFGDFRISIIKDNSPLAGCRISNPKAGEYIIAVGAGLNPSDTVVEKLISDCMKKIARHIAPSILIPQVSQLASTLGCRPTSLSISTGRRTLGRCNTRGEIAISCMVAFLPPELRDYIICHELTHLTEMNHSAAFHRLCDSYCGGNERRLVAALRKFRFPVV